MSERRWLPTFAELIDRMSIHQLKEVMIPENKENYAKELADLEHDVSLTGKGVELDGRAIRIIIALAQVNTHIWYNEARCRAEGSGGDLRLTHGLNGIRTRLMNALAEYTGDRKDYKADCIAAEFAQWEMSVLK